MRENDNPLESDKPRRRLGLVEYILILILIGVVVVVVIALLPPAMGTVFTNLIHDL